MVRRTALIESFQLVLRFRKVHPFETGTKIRKTMVFADFIRQRISNIPCKITQSPSDNPPQLPAGDARHFLVDGHVAANIERCRLIATLYYCFALSGLPFGLQELELRIEKHEL